METKYDGCEADLTKLSGEPCACGSYTISGVEVKALAGLVFYYLELEETIIVRVSFCFRSKVTECIERAKPKKFGLYTAQAGH